jgi:hypothetical protein
MSGTMSHRDLYTKEQIDRNYFAAQRAMRTFDRLAAGRLDKPFEQEQRKSLEREADYWRKLYEECHK